MLVPYTVSTRLICFTEYMEIVDGWLKSGSGSLKGYVKKHPRFFWFEKKRSQYIHVLVSIVGPDYDHHHKD